MHFQVAETEQNELVISVIAVATDCIVFVGVFLPVRMMKFCRNKYFDNRSKPREFNGHRSKVKVTRAD